jgi:ABC-type dipeptide/oligopeptide/nickel transport system ATPase subunit
VLEINGVSVAFKKVPVLHDIELTVGKGQTVGLVGESGSGKSTLAKVIAGAVRPDQGTVRWEGTGLRLRQAQLIPQDPYSSLNPRMTVGEAIAEAIDPRRARTREHQARITELLGLVALPGDAAKRYPHEFSGGQRQRIAIARALAASPQLIIADEITSALDSTVQAEVLGVLRQLRQELGLTMLFISHDLAVVQHVSDEVAVLLQGRIVEKGPGVFSDPAHDYTRRLLDSVPKLSIGQ